MFKKQEYLAYLAAKNFSPMTLEARRIHLNRFYKWLSDQSIKDMRCVTTSRLQEYQYYLFSDYRTVRGEKISVGTVLARLTALRGYFGYLAEQKYILLDPAKNLLFPKKEYRLPKNLLNQEEVKSLLNSPGDRIMDLRDKAILETLYSTGIRSAELCKLNVYDVNLNDQTVRIIDAKGKKDRILPIGNMAKEALERYLLYSRAKIVRDMSDQTLFLTQYGTKMVRQSLIHVIKTYAQKMRLNKPVTTHSLRHAFATHLLQNGADIITVQRLLGHTKLETTQIYTKVTMEDLRSAIKKHHPRY